MAKYSTTFDETQADVLRTLASNLDGFAERLNAAGRKLDTRDYTMSRLASAVRADANTVPTFALRLRTAGSTLSYAVGEYRNAEKAAQASVGSVSALVEAKPAADNRSWLEKLRDGVFNVGKNVVNAVSGAYSWLSDAMKPGGVLFKPFQIGKAIVGMGMGAATMVISIASLVGSGGLSTPAAVLGVIYGGNQFANSLKDLIYVTSTDDPELLEQGLEVNFLEDGLKYVGGGLGGMIGGETGRMIGETIGSVAYIVGDVYTGQSIGKLMDSTEAVNTGAKAVSGTAGTVGKLLDKADDVSDVATTVSKADKALDAAKKTYDVLDKASDIIDDAEKLSQGKVAEVITDKLIDKKYEDFDDLDGFDEFSVETMKELEKKVAEDMFTLASEAQAQNNAAT